MHLSMQVMAFLGRYWLCVALVFFIEYHFPATQSILNLKFFSYWTQQIWKSIWTVKTAAAKIA